jgi:hypothetical protein
MQGDGDLLKNTNPALQKGEIPVLGYALRRTQLILSNCSTLSEQMDDIKKNILQKVARLPYRSDEAPIEKLVYFDPYVCDGTKG